MGVATQECLNWHAKFDGTPEMVMHFMAHIAEEVREILADLGFRSLDEVVGHPEMLEQVIHGRDAGFMDLAPLLYVPDTGSARRKVLPKNEIVANETVGDRIVEQVLASLTANPDAPVRLAHRIANTERTKWAHACSVSSRCATAMAACLTDRSTLRSRALAAKALALLP